jgi:hypothetical protein
MKILLVEPETDSELTESEAERYFAILDEEGLEAAKKYKKGLFQ